jgi:hypothetical protein
MTREEILTATPEWLNEQTAIAMGWPRAEIKDYLSDEYINLVIGKNIYFHIGENGRIYRIGMGMMDEDAAWNPSEDIRDAWELEEKIKKAEMIVRLQYIISLTGIIGFRTISFDDLIATSLTAKGLFSLTHATPEQRTKSFLLATAKEN